MEYEYKTRASAMAALKRGTTPKQRVNYRIVKQTRYTIEFKSGRAAYAHFR